MGESSICCDHEQVHSSPASCLPQLSMPPLITSDLWLLFTMIDLISGIPNPASNFILRLVRIVHMPN